MELEFNVADLLGNGLNCSFVPRLLVGGKRRPRYNCICMHL